MGPIPILISLALAFPQLASGELAPGPVAGGADPAINRPFQGAGLERWTNLFERPGREVFDQRLRILETSGVQPGMRVADIGAGTGLFAALFAHAVGASGLVYAVDVSPGFVSSLGERARVEGLTNLIPVLNTQNDSGLKPSSIDLAFVCDTYHHFEDPGAMLASIRRALAPRGTLIVIDYHRRPGVSPPWVLGHVRSDREQVVREVTAAGFLPMDSPELLRQSYYLRFKKVDAPTARPAP